MGSIVVVREIDFTRQWVIRETKRLWPGILSECSIGTIFIHVAAAHQAAHEVECRASYRRK